MERFYFVWWRKHHCIQPKALSCEHCSAMENVKQKIKKTVGISFNVNYLPVNSLATGLVLGVLGGRDAESRLAALGTSGVIVFPLLSACQRHGFRSRCIVVII